MLEHRKAIRHAAALQNSNSMPTSSLLPYTSLSFSRRDPNTAAARQAVSAQSFEDYMRRLEAQVNGVSQSDTNEHANATQVSNQSASLSPEELDHQSELEDTAIVEAELARYIAAGLEPQTPHFKLPMYWQVQLLVFKNVFFHSLISCLVSG